MPNNETFNSLLQFGHLGEEFVTKYLGRLTSDTPLYYRPIDTIQYTNSEAGIDKSVFVSCGDGIMVLVHSLENGYTFMNSFFEVKTLSTMSLLRFGIRNDITLPFEIFETNNQQPDTSKWNPGWFAKVAHCKEYNRSHDTYDATLTDEVRVVMPSMVFFLCTKGSQFDPFVSIVIRNFDKLFESVLIPFARQDLGIPDLRNWDWPPFGDSWYRNKHSIHQSLWNVPLSIFGTDNVDVTMINEPPTIDEIRSVTDERYVSFAENRLNSLISYSRNRGSNGKLIPADEDHRMGVCNNERVHYFSGSIPLADSLTIAQYEELVMPLQPRLE